MRPGRAHVHHDRGPSILAIGVVAVVVIGAAIAPWICAHIIVVVGVGVGVGMMVGAAATFGTVMLARRRHRRAAALAAELESQRLARLRASRTAQSTRVTQTGVRDLHIHLHG